MSTETYIIAELPDGRFIRGYAEFNGGPRDTGYVLSNISIDTCIKVCKLNNVSSVWIDGSIDVERDDYRIIDNVLVFLHEKERLRDDFNYENPPEVIYNSLEEVENDSDDADFTYIYFMDNEISVYRWGDYIGKLKDILNDPDY